ncbi:TauD/TfdA family dioxygenase [Rhodosalinus halophilus]|uniref:TauD/TfdA family dioxygenase n=1 Tax=Rhodosalinus halophilus TaxID=2259333 RepID=A0A365UAB7_9RHOB|nr:TauD/TfdA family dioxygenase [Rhodosalinus halophilus]RBI85945.1 TauD/TfdA family dioxygenase [Rhodosalinus halophilus]
MTTLDTTPLTPAFGVEVRGVRLDEVTESRLFPEIRAAFEAHSALLFRDQALSPEAHLRLARLFGPIEDRKADERAEGEAFEIPEVSNLRAEGGTWGETDLATLNLKANMLWHTDSTFLPVPALTNILVARVVPSEGGATELASTRAAFAAMSPERQDQLRRLRLRHRYSHSRAQISPELAELPMFNKWDDQVWPAVWRNPVNGAEAVYVASHACAVEGMDAAEGRALIAELIEACTRPEFVYAHRWRPGDVLIWDQRAVMHRGTPWPYEEPRKLTSICVSATPADGLDTMRREAAG